MERPPSEDPFSSRRRAPRITPWTLLTFVFSVPVGLWVGVQGAPPWVIMLVIVGPVILLLGEPVLLSLWRWWRGEAEPSDSADQATTRSELIQAAIIDGGVAARQLVLSMGAVLLIVAVAVGTTLIRAPWLSLPIGLAITGFLRAYRGRSGFLAALAFAGIPLALYGAFAGFVQWRWF
jgi:hypothetical protein